VSYPSGDARLETFIIMQCGVARKLFWTGQRAGLANEDETF